MANILVIAAHPDDEMAMSGTIAAFRRKGKNTKLITFSPCIDESPIIKKEYLDATLVLGITDVWLFNYPNKELWQYATVIRNIMWGIRNEYDYVFVPATWDEHQDHQVVTQEAIRTFKDARASIFGYELPYNTVRESRVNMYVQLDDLDMELKLKHLNKYRSQVSTQTYMTEDYVKGLARLRGVQSGVTYAEGFEVIRLKI